MIVFSEKNGIDSYFEENREEQRRKAPFFWKSLEVELKSAKNA